MNKTIVNRIKRLEQERGTGNGLSRYFAAISNLYGGLPPNPTPPISPEKQAEIDGAFSQLSEEELAMLSGM